MHNHTSSVSDCFADTTHCDDICKEICLVSRSKEELKQSTERKYCDEEGIEAKIWGVSVDSIVNSAGWRDRGAVLVDVVPHIEF